MFLSQATHLLSHQKQDLLINLAMRQAFHVMQLPVLELTEWLHQEIENNPVLEVDLSQEVLKESLEFTAPASWQKRNRSELLLERKQQEQQENQLIGSLSLYEHLMQQVPLHFENRDEIHLAGLIIGHLNEKGLLDIPLQEVAPSIPLFQLESVLAQVQSLDPLGVGARDIKEVLLIQLAAKESASQLAKQIVGYHFDLLLGNQIPLLAKRLDVSMAVLNQVIKEEILPLDLYPGYRFSSPVLASIIPDVVVCFIEDKWYIEVNSTLFPKFHISPFYQRVLFKPDPDESSYIRQKIAAGKWLKRAVEKRSQTLYRIVEFLLKKQAAFFSSEGRGGLVALTLREAAEALQLHESTVARAVSHKFIACPQGMFALRCFFKQGVPNSSKEKMSNQTLKELLLKAIDREDKLEPLSDEEISLRFKRQGISCARRTISKYRNLLNIGSAYQRRKFN